MYKTKKQREMEFVKGGEIYTQLEVLIDILNENREYEKLSNKDRVYLFNELDLMLSKGVNISWLIECVKYRKEAMEFFSEHNKNFDANMATRIEKVNEFLQDLEMNLQEGKIMTKYAFYIDGKEIKTTQEHDKVVKNYLRANGVVLNEMTYYLALRRLMVGGDIESKFDKNYFTSRVDALKSDRESGLSLFDK